MTAAPLQRQRLGEPALDRHGPQPVQRAQGPGGIALLDLGQRLHRPQVLGLRPAGDPRGGRVRGGRPPVAEGVEGLGPQPQRLEVLRLVVQQRARGGRARRRTRRARRPAEPRPAATGTASSGRPPSSQCRATRAGGPRGRQAAGGVAVDRDPVVRRDLLDEGLADQVVPEAVAGPGDDQRAGVERGVEQRERVRLGQPGQRGHAGRVEVVAGHREPAQHRGGGVVEVEETRR